MANPSKNWIANHILLQQIEQLADTGSDLISIQVDHEPVSGAETDVLGSPAFNAPSLDERMAWLHAL